MGSKNIVLFVGQHYFLTSIIILCISYKFNYSWIGFLLLSNIILAKLYLVESNEGNTSNATKFIPVLFYSILVLSMLYILFTESNIFTTLVYKFLQ